MNLCSRWEAAWEALDLATENSKQSANFLFRLLLICQKKKDHFVTVHIQFSSSVVPMGGSVKCQQDCQLVLNMLLTFLGACGSSGFIPDSKAPLLPCCLQTISPICVWLTCCLLLLPQYFCLLGNQQGRDDSTYMSAKRQAYCRISFKQKNPKSSSLLIVTNCLYQSRIINKR